MKKQTVILKFKLLFAALWLLLPVLVAVAQEVRVETAADGSGTVISDQNLTAGSSITVFAIERDAGGIFVANVAADSWAVESKTAGVVDGDLVVAGDNKSATFTGKGGGTATLRAYSGILTPVASGTITVVAGAAVKLQILVPGETAMPGLGSGKTGTPNSQSNTAPFNVTVNAVDTYWNVVNTATDVIAITSATDGSFGAPANAALVGGTKVFSVTFNTSGNQTVTATDTDGTPLSPSTSPTIAVLQTPKYRSNLTGGGNWNDPATWQVDNTGAGFVPAGGTPTSGADTIVIRSGDTVTVTAAVIVDQVTVDAGATVVVNGGNLTIANGADDVDMAVSGILRLASAHTITPTGKLQFNSGAKYDHHVNARAVPAATWSVGSTCEITGPDAPATFTSVPSGLGQVFYNFTWNCPGILTARSLSGALTNVSGDYTFLVVGVNDSTGNSSIRHFNADGQSLTIGGSLIVSNGAVCSFSRDNTTIRVAKNVTASGTAGLGNYKYGNLELNGNGSSEQIVTVAADSIVSGLLNFNVNTNARVKLASDLNLGSPSARTMAVNGALDLNGFNVTGSGLTGTGTIDTTAASTAVTLTVGANTLTNDFNGVIKNSGSGASLALAKLGTGTQILGGTNTYTGTTTVNNGKLLVNGSLAAGSTVTVNAGTLGGTGKIGGNTTVNGTLSPGTSIGTLTFGGTLSLNNNTLIQVNKDTATKDLITGVSTLSYGGTLTVEVEAGTLQFGDSFVIASASSPQNDFASIVGSPGPGLGWSFNPATGVLSVGNSTTPVLKINSITASGTDLTLAGTGGTAFGAFNVLTSSDITASLLTWSGHASGSFDESGNFSVTFAAPGTSPSFFVIQE